MKKVMVIGGSDSGGGAGIQADLKTVAALGCFATTVVTALTAQNTIGVQSIHAVPPDFVAEQIDSIMADIGADAVKTGMLLNEGVVTAVSDKMKQHGLKNVVVDPVLYAKDGSTLLAGEGGVKALVTGLLPLAAVVTPNIPEAEVLSGVSIKRPIHMEEAAIALYKLGAGSVLIKGGHAPEGWPSREKGMVEDLFYDGRDFRRLVSPMVNMGGVHGGGCTLASAIAVGLAEGKDVEEAVISAREFIGEAIKFPIRVGRGYSLLNPYGAMRGSHR